jgi:hypothetical protein
MNPSTWPTEEQWEASLAQLEELQRDPAYPSQRGRWLAYGLSFDDYQKMAKAQGGACAICREQLSDNQHKVHVDHDHECAHPRKDAAKCCRSCVRGILCNRCNILAGWIENNRSLLPAVHAYLEAPASERPLSDPECPATGCLIGIGGSRKPMCDRHWAEVPPRLKGAFWDGRATETDVIAAVNRKLERRQVVGPS